MLHVANGDHPLSILLAAGLPGNVIAWSDVLDQGPLRGEPATPGFRLARGRWLEENGAGTLPEVNAQLEAWDAALQAPADERVLWFEADLTCQLALLHHLVLVDGRLDYRAQAKDRWVGGVLLQGPSCFRRDGSRIIPP